MFVKSHFLKTKHINYFYYTHQLNTGKLKDNLFIALIA